MKTYFVPTVAVTHWYGLRGDIAKANIPPYPATPVTVPGDWDIQTHHILDLPVAQSVRGFLKFGIPMQNSGYARRIRLNKLPRQSRCSWTSGTRFSKDFKHRNRTTSGSQWGETAAWSTSTASCSVSTRWLRPSDSSIGARPRTATGA